MSIEVKNLTRIYGEQKAIDDISFSVRRGEIVGFLGPNGAGKSTTMKILTGCLKPSKGQAFLNGIDVNVLSCPDKKNNGLPARIQSALRRYVYPRIPFFYCRHSQASHQKNKKSHQLSIRLACARKPVKKFRNFRKGINNAWDWPLHSFIHPKC